MPFLISFLKGSGLKIAFVIGLVVAVIGSYFLSFRHGVNIGYRTGYSKALLDHPQNVYNAPTTVNQQRADSVKGVFLKIGRIGIGAFYE